MPNFKKYNYNQNAMVVINFEEQIQPGTFEFTLHRLIDNHIDLSAFYEKYSNDAGGRSAYDPAILLKIILYAYSKGITSSREIQRQCEQNIIFKALSCDSVPHFTSIASFISSYPDAIESVFTQVLIEKFLKTASPRMGRGKKPKEVKSNITDNQSAKMTTSKGTIQGYNGVAAVDKKHQIIIDAQAFGEDQEHHTLKPVLNSIKDRYVRTGISEDIYKAGTIVTADTGFSNEDNNRYLRDEHINAYIPDNQFSSRDISFSDQEEKYGKRHQATVKGIKAVIPASEFHFNKKNKTCRCPQGNEMWLSHEIIKVAGKKSFHFQGKLSDCRRCPIKHQCMRNPGSADTREGAGRQVSFTVSNGKTATDWMKRRVDSREGKVIYGHRMSTVEPVFGNLGSNKGLNRFSLRGKHKVQGQWQLYCLVHNIEKLANYAHVG